LAAVAAPAIFGHLPLLLFGHPLSTWAGGGWLRSGGGHTRSPILIVSNSRFRKREKYVLGVRE
jgi:hypothetical protein